MTCNDSQPLISIYVDEALDEARTTELFAHLAGCSGCRSFLRSTLDIRNAIRLVPRSALPVRGRILSFSPAKARDRSVHAPLPLRPSIWSRQVSLPVSAAATIAAVLLASVVALTSLWMSAVDREAAGREQVVYMARMPVVEVYATPSVPISKPQ